MKIGVTGTRSGMNETQIEAVYEHLQQFDPATTELHHGDCVGVDAEVAEIAKMLGMRTVCHPPEKTDLRAWFDSDETRKPLSYFARNRNIVDETEQLLVVPYQDEHTFLNSNNGGTLYTFKYAQKQNKPFVIFYP